MTQAELEGILCKNPSLKVHGVRLHAQKTPLIPEPTSLPTKYWNCRVYIQEKGMALRQVDPAMGKVITVFDSVREYRRHNDLLLQQKAGQITDLQRQTPFVIQDEFVYQGEKIKSIVYKADFTYTSSTGEKYVEDVKAFDETTQKHRTTKDFLLKWKLLKFKFPELHFVLY